MDVHFQIIQLLKALLLVVLVHLKNVYLLFFLVAVLHLHMMNHMNSKKRLHSMYLIKLLYTTIELGTKGGVYVPSKIPSYSLIIEEEFLNLLRRNILNDQSVPAQIQIENSNYKIQIAYRGAYTRKFKKRSYSIDFKNSNNALGVRKIHLNAEYKDPSLFRNKLSLDFFQDLGVLAPDSQHIKFYRNDIFKGVYLQLESVDDLFLKKRGLPPGPIYYATHNDANFSFERDGKRKRSLLSGLFQANGSPSDNHFLLELITIINTTPITKFDQVISNFINIDKYFSWLAGAVCTMNNDGFNHNYSLYRNSETGLFEIMPWDYDATWGRKINGGIMDHKYVPIEGKPGNKLSELLLQIPDFRKMYKEKLEDILESKFTVEYLKNKVLKLHQNLRPHYLLDPYINNSIDIFDYEPEMIFQFIHDRNNYLKMQLESLR